MLATKAILSIAGSDPSGGAGIQADLKTWAVIGVYGAAAVTCLTAQNTLGVFSFVPVEPGFLREQVQEVLTDIEVSHIKIGMVGTAALAIELGRLLEGFAGEIIYDPVMRAQAGSPLLHESAAQVIGEQVAGRATVLTPNLDELRVLTSAPAGSAEPLAMARLLLDRYPRLRAVVVKGGHLEEQGKEVTDSLVSRSGTGRPPSVVRATHRRISTRNTHGTGCTFAAAFAAYHQLLGNDRDAFRAAVLFVDFLITSSREFRIGRGQGPLLHHLWKQERIPAGPAASRAEQQENDTP